MKKLLPFLLLAALLLSACGASGAPETAPEAVNTASEAVTEVTDAAPSAAETAEAPVESSAGQPPEPTEALLRFSSRGDSVAGEYTDDSGNRSAYAYSLPVISGGTAYIDAVNAELDEIYETYIAPELAHMDKGLSLVTTRVSWRAAEYNAVTSLLVCLHNSWDERLYCVYAFTADGEQATNADLFAALGISAAEFTAAAAETLTDELGPGPSEDRPAEIRAALEEAREKTLAPENCNAELPVYVTSCGTVCFVGRVYTVAGAGRYDHLFVITPPGGFSAEELTELARDYCAASTGRRPDYAAAEENEDGTVTVRLYYQADACNSDSVWYTVSPETGAGLDFTGNRVDLTVQ